MSFELSKPNNENEPLVDKDESGAKASFLGLTWEMLISYFINGFLNTVSLGDYFLMLWVALWILRSEEAHDQTLNDIESSTFSSYIVVFEVCIMTASIGLSETLGIYGSQALGGAKEVIDFEVSNGDETEFDAKEIRDINSRPYQLMTQGKIMAAIIIVIGTPLFLKSSPFLLSLSGGGEGSEDTLTFVTLFLTPATFLKMFIDQEKHFLFNFQKYKWIGIFSLINIILSTLITFILVKAFGNNRLMGIVLSLNIFQILSWIGVELAFVWEFSEKERKSYLDPSICPRKKLWKFCWEAIKNSFTELYFPIVIQVMFLIVKIVGSDVENIAYMAMFKSMRALIFVGYGFYIWPRTKINWELGKNLYVKNEQERKDFSADYFLSIMKMNVFIYGIVSIIMIFFNIFNTNAAINRYRSDFEFGGEVEKIPISIYIYSSLVVFIYLNTPFIAGIMRSINMKYFLICYNSFVPYFVLPFIFYMKFMKRKISGITPSTLVKDFLSPASSEGDDHKDGLTLKDIYFYIFVELCFRVVVYLGFLWIKNKFDDVQDDLLFKLEDEEEEKKDK